MQLSSPTLEVSSPNVSGKSWFCSNVYLHHIPCSLVILVSEQFATFLCLILDFSNHKILRAWRFDPSWTFLKGRMTRTHNTYCTNMGWTGHTWQRKKGETGTGVVVGDLSWRKTKEESLWERSKGSPWQAVEVKLRGRDKGGKLGRWRLKRKEGAKVDGGEQKENLGRGHKRVNSSDTKC